VSSLKGQGQSGLGELMKIRFHGRLAQAIGAEIDLDSVAGSCVRELRRRLAAEHPAAAATLEDRRAVACVGGAIVRDDHVIAAGEAVEFLPPVSGG
jgi:molybdopterin converting factor small subunit